MAMSGASPQFPHTLGGTYGGLAVVTHEAQLTCNRQNAAER